MSFSPAAHSRSDEVYDELCCDWPLLSTTDCAVFVDAVTATEHPAWFKLSDRLIQGILYVSDSGFSKAAVVAEGQREATTPVSPSALIVYGILHPLSRACTLDLHALQDELKLVRGTTSESPFAEPVFKTAGSEEGQGGNAADSFAEQEDSDDFVFESMESPAEDGDLSTLLDRVQEQTDSNRPCDWTWAKAAEKLTNLVRVINYDRLASAWESHRVEHKLLDLLCIVLKHEAAEDLFGIIERISFVLRDRMVREPAKSSVCLEKLLQLYLDPPKPDPALRVLALHCAAAAAKVDGGGIGLGSWRACLSVEGVAHAQTLWQGGAADAALLLSSRAEAWPDPLQTTDIDQGEPGGLDAVVAGEEAVVCKLAASVAVGAPGLTGATHLLTAGFMRSLLRRLQLKTYPEHCERHFSVDQAQTTAAVYAPTAVALTVMVLCSTETHVFLGKAKQMMPPALLPPALRVAWDLGMQLHQPLSTAKKSTAQGTASLEEEAVRMVGAWLESCDEDAADVSGGERPEHAGLVLITLLGFAVASKAISRSAVAKRAPVLHAGLSALIPQTQRRLAAVQRHVASAVEDQVKEEKKHAEKEAKETVSEAQDAAEAGQAAVSEAGRGVEDAERENAEEDEVGRKARARAWRNLREEVVAGMGLLKHILFEERERKKD